MVGLLSQLRFRDLSALQDTSLPGLVRDRPLPLPIMNIRTLLTLVAGLLAAVTANAAANIQITSQPQGIVVGQSNTA